MHSMIAVTRLAAGVRPLPLYTHIPSAVPGRTAICRDAYTVKAGCLG